MRGEPVASLQFTCFLVGSAHSEDASETQYGESAAFYTSLLQLLLSNNSDLLLKKIKKKFCFVQNTDLDSEQEEFNRLLYQLGHLVLINMLAPQRFLKAV